MAVLKPLANPLSFSSSISVAPTHRTSLTLPATRLSSVNNGNQVRWKFHGISNKTVRPEFPWRGKAQTQINEWLITDDEKETSFSTHYPKFDQPEGSPPDQSHRFFQLFYQSHVAYLQHLLQQSTMARSEILSQLQTDNRCQCYIQTVPVCRTEHACLH